MSWLAKDLQISVLVMIEMQQQAYKQFLETYGTQALALKHTKIFMDAAALMVQKPGGN